MTTTLTPINHRRRRTTARGRTLRNLPPVPVVAVGTAAVVFTATAAVTGSLTRAGLLAATQLARTGIAALVVRL